MTHRRNVSTAVLAGVAVVSLLVGAIGRGLLSPDGSAAPLVTASPVVADRGPGPWGYVDGIPVGFARTESGARAAATGYVVTGQAMVDLAPTRLPEAIDLFAASDTAAEQVADTSVQIAALRDRLAAGRGPIRYVQAVMASRVDAYTTARARVSVWSVGVLWRQGAADPQAGWTTSTFDLVWESSTWKVWAETVTAGPTPAPNAGPTPVTAAELDEALAGYKPWAGRP